MNLSCFILLLGCFSFIDGANILGLFPIPMVSHQVVFRPLMENLSKRGHQVTVMTTDPVDYKDEFPNLRQIDVHDMSYNIWLSTFNYGKMGQNKSSASDFQAKLTKTFIELTKAQLNHKSMLQLLGDPDAHFDLCFIECWVESMFPIKDHFNCSLILISSLTGSLSNFDAFGNPSNPAIFVDVSSPYYVGLNFWERLHQIYRNIRQRRDYYFWDVPQYDAFCKEHFGKNTRSVIDIHNDADMLFINGHPILAGIRPSVPGIIYMDNMNIRQPKPLSQKLEQILDQSKMPVVYFSLGSNVKSIDLSLPNRKAFLHAFRELPFTVLWKWEDEHLPGKPDNVHIMKWMPQQEILAHPNVAAFITQGGQQSLEEAIYYTVPMIGLPFMIDQKSNALKMVNHGIGIALSLDTLSKHKIKDAISTVINDPSYKINITKLSILIKDQPETGLERAVWWTEYVIRNKGAKQLKAESAKVSFVKYFFIDIFAFIIGCLVVLLSLISFIAKIILSCCCKMAHKLKTS